MNQQHLNGVVADMDGQHISRMRSRAEQLRRVVSLAHDPRIIETVQRVINEIEADVRTLEANEPVTRVASVDT